MPDPVTLLEAVAAGAALPVLARALAARRRSRPPVARVPTHRELSALVRRLPPRHRRAAKAIVALALDQHARHDDDPLDAYTGDEALRRYLPDTIEAYLAVPRGYRRLPRGNAPSPDVELARQFAMLRAGLERTRDVDAESAHGRMTANRYFLTERFGPAPPGGASDGVTGFAVVGEIVEDIVAWGTERLGRERRREHR